ncbi:MAG: nuclear transport factor 2 family protein [Chloroflexota bacterium]
MGSRDEIEKLTAKFAKAVTEKDVGALEGFYEEGARFLPPGAPMAVGLAAIREAQQHMIEGGVQGLELEAVDVIEAGDFVIEIGRTKVTVQPPGAPSRNEAGKSVVVWHRGKDGSFKIVVDILNSDRRPGPG